MDMELCSYLIRINVMNSVETHTQGRQGCSDVTQYTVTQYSAVPL